MSLPSVAVWRGKIKVPRFLRRRAHSGSGPQRHSGGQSAVQDRDQCGNDTNMMERTHVLMKWNEKCDGSRKHFHKIEGWSRRAAPRTCPKVASTPRKTANSDILAFHGQDQSGDEINMMERNHIMMKRDGNIIEIGNNVIGFTNDHHKPPLEKRADFRNGGLF